MEWYCEFIENIVNPNQICHRAIIINEVEREVDRTSADEKQNDVTLREPLKPTRSKEEALRNRWC